MFRFLTFQVRCASIGIGFRPRCRKKKLFKPGTVRTGNSCRDCCYDEVGSGVSLESARIARGCHCKIDRRSAVAFLRTAAQAYRSHPKSPARKCSRRNRTVVCCHQSAKKQSRDKMICKFFKDALHRIRLLCLVKAILVKALNWST